MSNLSDFLGGSGGGGDPQATFQASANVANGDLVILNNNGTVAPVSQQSFSANITTSQTGSQLTTGTTNPDSGNGRWTYYNDTNAQFVQSTEIGSTVYLSRAVETSVGSGQWTISSIASRVNVYETHLAQGTGSSSDYFYWGYRDNAGNIYVEPVYHNGSNYTNGSNIGISGSVASGSKCLYIGNNDDGTIAVAARCNSNQRIGACHLNYTGGSSITRSSGNPDITSGEAPATLGSTTVNGIDDGGFAGVHVGGNVHVIHFRNNSDGANPYIVAVEITATGNTWGTPVRVSQSGGVDQVQMAYDTEGNVGMVAYANNFVGFTVSGLTITTFSVTGLTYTSVANQALAYNSIAKQFMFLVGANRAVELFTLSSDGTQGAVTTLTLDGTETNTYGMEYPRMAKMQGNTARTLITFHASVPGGTGHYITNSNQGFMTSFTPAYETTNIDSYFGEAKDAITSGSTGPVGIMKRTVDFAGSSFTKGKELFVNSGGSAMSETGTVRVGYATDSDTILVTGEPS